MYKAIGWKLYNSLSNEFLCRVKSVFVFRPVDALLFKLKWLMS